MWRTGLIGVVLALVSVSARADDSSAALDAGGLVLTRSANIRMVDERLSISPKRVNIRFEFLNETDQPIDALVAFPMPDIDARRFSVSELGATTEDPVNFMGFRVSSNGVSTAFEVEQRALIGTRDVTAAVKAGGLPINPITLAGTKKLQTLSPALRKILSEAKVADVSDPKYVIPLWTVQTRLYWHQHFPAHVPVVLEQSYQPVTGQSFFGSVADETESVRDFCLDARARGRLTQMSKTALAADKKMNGYLDASETDYVLKTGANWKGPIGHFHLVLDKLSPENVLSLCWKGALNKTGPTTYEFDANQFAPTEDIRMLVVGPLSH